MLASTLAPVLPAHGRPIEVIASDGARLGAHVFDSEHARATVVIHGATAVPQRFYTRFSRFLAQDGYRVVTYDYRGIGESRVGPLSGLTASMTDWAVLDGAAVIDYVKRHYPEEPLAHVGHSFGGHLIGLTDSARSADAAVLIACPFAYTGHWDHTSRLGLRLWWSLAVPAVVSLLGYLPGGMMGGEDVPGGVAREWSRWCRSPGYLCDHDPGAAGRFSRFAVPTLVMSFTDDSFAPARTIEALSELLPQQSLRSMVVAPEDVGVERLGHLGFFLSAHRDTLWSHTREFLDRALAGEEVAEMPDLPRNPRSGVSADDIQADLDFGRS